MTDDRIRQLTAELLAADPALRTRETEVRELVGELVSLRLHAGIDAGFRDALEQRLRAASARVVPHARPVRWQMPALYWGLGTVAVVVLIAINLMRTPEGPVQVAVQSESESTSPAGTSGDAPILMAARKDAASAPAMRLIVSGIEDGQPVPREYTCDGADLRPAFSFADVPAGTVSFAIIVDDPDAPSGVWTHWVAFNIDGSVAQVPQDALPTGTVEGRTSWGAPGWRGPCPPSGMHRYAFTLYALDTMLAADRTVTAAALRERMAGHVLAESVLTGTYQR